MKPRWMRLREATAAATAPQLERGGGAIDDDPNADDDLLRTSGPGDGDGDDETCPTCDGAGIKGGDLCSSCGGSGSVMKESTSGPYWVYSDDPEWDKLREASRSFSTDVRKKYAGQGIALPDGSYPIPDADALGRAVSSFGHNPTPAVKAHIVKRARALGQTSKLPEDWAGSSKSKEAEPFGGKKAPPFGKGEEPVDDDKKDAKDGKTKGDKGKTKEATTLVERLDGLEEEMKVFRTLREAKPGKMTPAFSTPTRVTASTGQEGYQVTLIREGRGNAEDDQWYTRDAVMELCESGVCEGMQAYGDHPDLEEEELRPERTVKDLVGTYHDVKFAESGGKARADAILVPLTLDEHHPRYGWVVTLAEAATRSTASQPICGISLYGLSAGDDGERPDGTHGRVVDMVRPSSGDIVTNAGAGGGFVRQIMESARALRKRSTKELTPMKSMAYQSAVREAVKRVREADSDETRTEALEALSALESEQIDNVPDSVAALREAAPGLVKDIETSVTAEVKEADKDNLEAVATERDQLKVQLREAQSTLGEFTNAINITEHLRSADVEDPVELRHYAGMAQQRGLREAADIKEMVEADRAFHEARRNQDLEKMRESLGLDEDAEVEGIISRVPVGALPGDGGTEVLRESGLPLVTESAE